MSLNLNLKDKLSFGEANLKAPNKVLEEIGEQLLQETCNCVKGYVESYNGAIESYTRVSTMASIGIALGTASTKVDVQDSLGRVGANTQKYQFYLRTPVYEDYMYRILFLEFGLGHYPVKVVLESSIADEVSENGKYVFSCGSPEDLEQFVIKILTSKTVIDVMQELIHINQIKKEEIIESESASGDVQDE